MMHKVVCTKKINPSLIASAAKNNVQIVVAEMIKIDLAAPELIRPSISSANCRVTVFTSKNAVHAVSPFFDLIAEGLFEKIYAMGGATTQALSRFNKLPVATAEDAAALADVIIKQEEPGSIAFFCGNKHRPELPLKLSSAGFDVQEIEVYTTTLTPTQVEGIPDGAIFFSPSAAESFFSVNTLDPTGVCFSVGYTTTSAIETYTQNKIFTAAYPSEQEMIELVVSYFKKDSNQDDTKK